MSQDNFFNNDQDEIIYNGTNIYDDDNKFMTLDTKTEKQILNSLSKLISGAIEVENFKVEAEAKDKVESKVEDIRATEFITTKIQEDFGCNKVCSKNASLGLFEHEDTKCLLFIIAILFLCAIIFRK